MEGGAAGGDCGRVSFSVLAGVAAGGLGGAHCDDLYWRNLACEFVFYRAGKWR